MLVERLLRIALLGSTWVMYLLLILSVFSIAIIVERVFYFRRVSGNTDALADSLTKDLNGRDLAATEKKLKGSATIEAQVIGDAIAFTKSGPSAFSDAVDSAFSRKRKDLERGLNYLGTLGSNAPFIGLFGTVIGVIEAFHQLGDANNKGAMGNVMSGIAEALVATGVGLFVAIPAVVAYNIIQKRVSEIEGNVAGITKHVSAVLKSQKPEDADPRLPLFGSQHHPSASPVAEAE